jgi:hypothetical protein
METATRILRYILVAMLVLLLGSAAGWFLYMRSKQNPLPRVENGTAAPIASSQSSRGGTTGNTASTASSTGETTGPKQIEKLWRVDPGPVAGFAFTSRVVEGSSASSSLFFAERATGYVLSADPNVQRVTRITNTLMSKIYEADFAQNGEYALLRSVNDNGVLTTFAALFPIKSASTTPQTLTGSYLSNNIRDVALDNGGKSVFLLTDDPGGGSIGTSMLFDGTKSTKVFSSFVRSWRPLIAQKQLFVLTKPGDGLPGYVYSVSATGALTPLVSGVPGLTVALHPTEQALLYAESSGSAVSLFLQVGKVAPVPLSIQTIADKCVWAPGKPLIAYCAVPEELSSTKILNEWYSGILHTNDSWWKIDAATGDAERIYTPTVPLDVHDPVIDPTGNFLAFTNGSDQSLWMLRLVQ